MAQKLKKHKKKPKVKIPKIQKTKDGRKFVRIGKRTVYLDDDITASQLLKFVLSRVLKKPQGRESGQTKDGKRTIEIARPTSTVSSGPSNGIDRVAKLLEEQKRDLERKEYEKKLKKKIDDEIAEKIPKHKLLMSGDERKLLKDAKSNNIDMEDPLFLEYYPDIHRLYHDGEMSRKEVNEFIKDELGKGIRKLVDQNKAAHQNIDHLKKQKQAQEEQDAREKKELKTKTAKEREERIKKKRESKINDELRHVLYDMTYDQAKALAKKHGIPTSSRTGKLNKYMDLLMIKLAMLILSLLQMLTLTMLK